MPSLSGRVSFCGTAILVHFKVENFNLVLNLSHFSEFDIKNTDQRVFKGQCKSCHKTIRFKIKDELKSEKGLLERDSISFFINGQLHTGRLWFKFEARLFKNVNKNTSIFK